MVLKHRLVCLLSLIHADKSKFIAADTVFYTHTSAIYCTIEYP